MTIAETSRSDSTDTVDRRFTSSVTIRLGDHPQIPQPMPGLLEGRVTLIAGAGGAGKTTLTEQLVRHMASGHQLGRFPLPDEPCGAWCMFLEDDNSMSQDRSLRVAPRGTLEEDRTGITRVEYLSGRDWSMTSFSAALQVARDDARLPGIVIVDHLRILIGNQPPGTSPNDWERRNLLQLVNLAGEYGIHIVVLTHLNKAGSVSGTTELINCVDSAFVIEPKDDRMYATLKCHKMRLAPETDYALSRKANGTWGFDDEVFVSETLAQGIARDILGVLRADGPKTLSELITHPAVSGTRRGIQQALTRAKGKGWVRSVAGHWEIVPSDGDTALRAEGGCAVCGGVMERLYEGQTSHPGCDVERQMTAAQPTSAPADDEDLDVEEDQDQDEAHEDKPEGFQGLEMLRQSIDKSRMNPISVIRKEDRDGMPWSLITEAMGGEPMWIRHDFDRETIRNEQGKAVGYRIIDPSARGGKLVVIDRNGSFPSGCSSVPLAPNKLTHSGPLEKYDRKFAGIYLIERPEWTDENMANPLGRIVRYGEGPVWVSTPHLRHLVKLYAADRIGPVVILDSWTGRANETLFEPFSKQTRAAREVLYGTGQPYTDYKVSLSKALRALWPKADKANSPFWRPDWRTAMVAEASIRHWVMADNAVKAGATLAALKSVDEAVFWTPDGVVPAPYKVGVSFGQVKVKGDE